MVMSSNGNIFRVTGHLCREFPAQRPVTQSFDVFFDLRLNKGYSKQSWGWWFETLSRSLWRHRYDTIFYWMSCFQMCHILIQSFTLKNKKIHVKSSSLMILISWSTEGRIHTSKTKENSCCFSNIFKSIHLKENFHILNKIPLKFVLKA